ncbi:MAG: N-6 DNA methylase [Chloroflexi bacterium]|nr:N-6 DNA methylase [Chloroflexota bacterium]
MTYNNRSLFSDYYLEELVREDSHWQALRTSAGEYRQRIANVLEKAIPGIDDDTPEAEVERRLIRPVLDTLGHIYYVQPAVPSPEGVRRPDYAFFPSAQAQQEAEAHKGQLEFFRTALAVGDAKAWERSLDRRIKGPGDPFTNHNPSYQIDFYLRATERKWGVLTNGRHWRLYHRDLSYRLDVYYEVDLPQLITLDDDSFLYFLAFFHKEAFQPDGTGECFLDLAYRASTDYAAKVSEELKDNVYEALRLLAEGFLSFPGNGLKPEDLDLVRENAFIVIYRLLFILYAEAREFLPVANPTYLGTYSLRALAHEIEAKEPFEANLHPTATGYWSRLQELFRLINSGDDFLHIPPYNGRLFDDQKEHQSLAAWKIGDRYLAGAIDQLARARAAGRTGRGFVSYRDLSIRELGSIYEGLLEHRPQYATQDVAVVKDDKREKFVSLAELGGRKALKTYRAGSVYLETDKGERKATGSYYTPDYIVKYIVGNTLGPLLEEAKKSSGSLIDVILSLKVLDPAMGSGHFLVEATDYLARALVEALGGDHREMEEDDVRWARREVVERCIYGVDLNPLAVDLAKLSLWLSTVSLDKPLNFLDHHLRCGNSLIGARLEDLGQLPAVGKKKTLKAAPASQSLLEYWFHQNVATAVDNYFRIAAISSDKLQEIQEKEKLYGIARDILKRYRQVAHNWTSVYFGNEVPAEGYMSLHDKIRATDPEWAELEKQPWFADGVKMGEEERRFLHWELEFPEVFFDRNGQRLSKPGFDAVVGNPPYGAELLSAEKLCMTQHYESAVGRFDSYKFFLERSLKLAKTSGYTSLIVPNTWTYIAEYSKFREFAFSASSLLRIVVMHARVFEAAIIETVIPIFRLVESPEAETAVQVLALDFDATAEDFLAKAWKLDFTVPMSALASGPGKSLLLSSAPSNAELLRRIGDVSVPLGTIAWSGSGMQAYHHSRHTRAEMESQIYHSNIRISEDYLPQLEGHEAGRYEVSWADRKYVRYGKWLYAPQDISYFTGHRILVQQITKGMASRVNAAFADETLCFNASLTVAKIKDSSFSIFYLLGMLNGHLVGWLYPLRFSPKHVKPSDLVRLPIRRISFTTPKVERERLAAEAKRLYYHGLKKAGLA